ncbi:MAG: hypothetical protein V1802_02225 [Candidatus Aenigmatarchaeota archaeon]
MLREVFDSCNGRIELYKRAAEGDLQIDLQKDEILNSTGLRNPYYTENMRKWGMIQEEHPVLTAIYSIVYYATHLQTANKVCSYTFRLLKSKQKHSVNP